MPTITDAQIIDAAGEFADCPVADSGTAFITIQTSADWDGTLIVQVTNNGGVSWHQTNFRTPTGDATNAQYTTANTTAGFVAGALGATRLRVFPSAYVAGTATVWLSAAIGGSAVFLLAGLPAGSAALGAIEGQASDGVAVALKPVRVAGTDESNVTRSLRVQGSLFDLRTVAAGHGKLVEATLTRPANQTAYTANDEMTDTGGAIRTLTDIGRFSGGSGLITRITCSVSSNAATKPQLRLWIYDTTNTPVADNGAFSHSDGEGDTCLGFVDLTTFAVGDATANTGNFVMDSGSIAIPFKCAGSDDLFFRTQVLNAYTAGANSDTYKFRFHCELN